MTTEQELVRKALESVPDSERLNVYLEFDPLWTVGTGEFGHDLIQLAKGRNIAESMESWVQVNDEFVIKANPDVIVFGSYAGVNPETANAISQRSGWSSISAVSNRRIVGLDANLISRPGPRITTGLHELAKAIYPELVK
jgi:iron complex transport system substrate-binding protein